MTSLLEGAKRLVTRGSDLGGRIDGLVTAAEAAEGRLDETLVRETSEVARRALGRLRLSADHTVVALAGATGSGKSSTFNALTGLELSAVGVRRPTTSWTTACVWGAEGATELLEWLGIPPRHQVTRDSMLDIGRQDEKLAGTVLLDLPDHDSTEVSHHLEVDRLVALADLLVWVLDPQKYADAAIHGRYLAPLKSHQGVMLVVLNQIDTVPEDRRDAMLADVRRLLDQDGLTEVPVLPVSAREDVGIDELRSQIARRVADKHSTRMRTEADIREAAGRMSEVSGTTRAPELGRARARALDDALAEAAGIPTVVQAVHDSTRIRAGRATGWPVVSWLSKLRPDPLKRLHLDLGATGKQLTGRARTSIPTPTQVQRARVDTEVRALSDEVGGRLTRPWADAVRRASVAHIDDLNDRLDAAVGGVDLGVARIPAWAGVVRVLQWILIVAAVAGGLWLALLAGLGYLRVDEPRTPDVLGLPVPTVMLIGGVALGVLLGVMCRFLVAATARRRAASAERRLRAAVAEVSQDLVVGPVQSELDAYERVREGLKQALA